MQAGVEGFVHDMAELGLGPRTEAGLVVFAVTPVDGAYAGHPVETGVSTGELGSWPQIPPHWVHFAADIRFSETNLAASSKQGWSKHSRDIRGWGSARPADEWASHVRAVLEEAVA